MTSFANVEAATPTCEPSFEWSEERQECVRFVPQQKGLVDFNDEVIEGDIPYGSQRVLSDFHEIDELPCDPGLSPKLFEDCLCDFWSEQAKKKAQEQAKKENRSFSEEDLKSFRENTKDVCLKNICPDGFLRVNNRCVNPDRLGPRDYKPRITVQVKPYHALEQSFHPQLDDFALNLRKNFDRAQSCPEIIQEQYFLLREIIDTAKRKGLTKTDVKELIARPKNPKLSTPDANLPVTCGYNAQWEAYYQTSFYCVNKDLCLTQGFDINPHDCHRFKPLPENPSIWIQEGENCQQCYSYRHGPPWCANNSNDAVGDLALIHLGYGVYALVYQYQQAFLITEVTHGLVFAPTQSQRIVISPEEQMRGDLKIVEDMEEWLKKQREPGLARELSDEKLDKIERQVKKMKEQIFKTLSKIKGGTFK